MDTATPIEVEGKTEGNSRRQKARRSYSRTGLNAVKAKVNIRGLSAIDQRTLAARFLIAERDAWVNDMGGPEAISAKQRAILEAAVRTNLYVQHLDAWLMSQKSLINGRRRSVLPVLRERQSLVDSLARLLGQLGLERKVKQIDLPAAFLEVDR